MTNKITLVDDDQGISDDKQLSKTFSNLFEEVVKTLGVNDNFKVSNYSRNDLINNAIRNYENYSNIKNRREAITITSTFQFSGANEANVEKSIGNLDYSKVETFRNIPTKCLNVTSDICSSFLAAIWNQELIFNKKSPQKLKLVDITPVHNKEDLTKHSTNIQRENNRHSAFLIFQKTCKKISQKTIFLTYFGPLKANYR